MVAGLAKKPSVSLSILENRNPMMSPSPIFGSKLSIMVWWNSPHARIWALKLLFYGKLRLSFEILILQPKWSGDEGIS
jgi:hypothetical protein